MVDLAPFLQAWQQVQQEYDRLGGFTESASFWTAVEVNLRESAARVAQTRADMETNTGWRSPGNPNAASSAFYAKVDAGVASMRQWLPGAAAVRDAFTALAGSVPTTYHTIDGNREWLRANTIAGPNGTATVPPAKVAEAERRVADSLRLRDDLKRQLDDTLRAVTSVQGGQWLGPNAAPSAANAGPNAGSNAGPNAAPATPGTGMTGQSGQTSQSGGSGQTGGPSQTDQSEQANQTGQNGANTTDAQDTQDTGQSGTSTPTGNTPQAAPELAGTPTATTPQTTPTVQPTLPTNSTVDRTITPPPLSLTATPRAPTAATPIVTAPVRGLAASRDEERRHPTDPHTGASLYPPMPPPMSPLGAGARGVVVRPGEADGTGGLVRRAGGGDTYRAGLRPHLRGRGGDHDDEPPNDPPPGDDVLDDELWQVP